jgi:peptidoglycan/xylan/chitin deacetylase (PgdA/CDA1 family)
VPWIARWLAAMLAPRRGPIILMYHRIAEPRRDPWDLAVSPARFAEQTEVLRRTCRVLPMDRLVDRLAAGSLPADAAAITFDDGYRDNLTEGHPILARNDLPATVFLATAAIGSGAAFWWDELADLVLEAPSVAGMLPSRGLDIRLGAPEPGDRRVWRAADGAATARQSLYLDLWREFRGLDEAGRRTAMAEARHLFGGAGASDSVPMTSDDVRALTDGGLVAIGAHTVTHPTLSGLPLERQRAEIATSAATCREIVGDRVRGFAYPYGDRSAATISAVRAEGLAWACSTVARPVAAADDRWDLPRIQVADWDGETFARQLGLRERRQAGGRHV